MGFRIRRIATRFALILALAAVLPLVAYGAASIWSLNRGTRETVVSGNQNVATRAAEEIRRYVSSNAFILKALGADLQDTGLDQWQQTAIVRNYVLAFREFREITVFDESRQVVTTSRLGPPRVTIPANATIDLGGVGMSPIRVDDDLLPTTLFVVRMTRLNQPAGWLVGEFSLEEMWKMVDGIRIGADGYAMVVAPDGTLVAHGDPDKKTLVAKSTNMGTHPLVASGAAISPGTPGSPDSAEYEDGDGERQLAVASAIDQLGWTVIVEQPTSEAYASAAALQRQLTIAIALALLVMIGIGLLFGRRFIAPIFILQRGTQALAAGDLQSRVDIDTGDEFGALGQAFNSMADRLVELQEDVKRQERQAMFGRVAAGLVHDLSHPIQNIGNSTRLLLRDDLDVESRDLFHKTIERELQTLKRFMEDLRNIVKPKPIERFAMDINATVSEIVETMRNEGERNGIHVEGRFSDTPLVIDGDRFALGRVFRNLITNAIQATEAGGRVTVATARAGDQVEIRVTDTGAGIAADRISRIFDDFVTTKTRGLGLGLAISKRIVDQLDGTITVESELGRGTVFTLRFPARDDHSEQAAAS
jgi:signal transduction histidine kinase